MRADFWREFTIQEGYLNRLILKDEHRPIVLYIEDKDKEYIYESILRRMYTINDIPSCKVLDFIKQKYRFEKIELKMWQKC